MSVLGQIGASRATAKCHSFRVVAIRSIAAEGTPLSAPLTHRVAARQRVRKKRKKKAPWIAPGRREEGARRTRHRLWDTSTALGAY